MQAINPTTGEIYELVDGQWQSTNRQELAGKMAAEGMGKGEAFLVGAGRELTAVGRGIRNLYAQATGDEATQDQIAADESEAERHIAGTSDALSSGGRFALGAGRAAPYLATAPLGAGIGGAATRGVAGLAESMAIGGALGGVKYSGDQGTDAITGALLSGAGYGLGALAGRTVRAIRANGAEARAALMEAGRQTRAGQVLEVARDVAGSLPQKSAGEMAGDLAHAAIHMHPGKALGVVRDAAIRALQNESTANALLQLAGASGGRAGLLGGTGGRVLPQL